MEDPTTTVFVSAASAWEIATKFRLGKLPGAAAIVNDIAAVVTSQAFSPLPVTLIHAQRAGALAGGHRDPFDRMLIAKLTSRTCFLFRATWIRTRKKSLQTPCSGGRKKRRPTSH
jgi:PIN domain nuclease of toxin-antitoxin system